MHLYDFLFRRWWDPLEAELLALSPFAFEQLSRNPFLPWKSSPGR
jgi:hypothetical protein